METNKNNALNALVNDELILNSTFSEFEKGEDTNSEIVSEQVQPGKINFAAGNKTVLAKLEDLKIHTLSSKLYRKDDAVETSLLAENIEKYGLISKIIVNKDMVILSGRRRFEALKQLNVVEIEVLVIDLPEDEEGRYIISSNIQRSKTEIEKLNEIKYLIDRYGTGQGKKDGSGIKTNHLVASITGYSTYEINALLKIEKDDPALIFEVQKGEITLNAAVKKAESVAKKNAGIKSGLVVESLKPKNEDINCPCCGQKVKPKNEDYFFVKKWQNEIMTFINELVRKGAA